MVDGTIGLEKVTHWGKTVLGAHFDKIIKVVCTSTLFYPDSVIIVIGEGYLNENTQQ